MKKIAITITTINIPNVVEKMLSLKYDESKYIVDYIIAGDKKTPNDIYTFLNSLNGKTASKIIYLDIDKQRERFAHYIELWKHIPENSFARRNYADLYAYEENYDIIIRLDDDNFPCTDSFINEHAIVGDFIEIQTISSSNGWYNICELLDEENGIPFYPRGFPYDIRWNENSVESVSKKVKVGVNAGLWLGDPDVDAITRLCKPVNAINYNKKFGSIFALDKGTWCPINTQNTAFSKFVIPASFISPFAGRYDDIFSCYFLRVIMDHLGDYVSYGDPLVSQIRNYHNLWNDLELEMIGNNSCPEICNLLRDIQFKGSSYSECFTELINFLSKNIKNNKQYFDRLLEGMSIWNQILK
jgi:hypothetical protein